MFYEDKTELISYNLVVSFCILCTHVYVYLMIVDSIKFLEKLMRDCMRVC